MVLNWIWIAFFALAFLMAAGRSLVDGDLQVWSDVMNASFDQAAFAFEVSLGLTGVLTLWLGIMKIGERGGHRVFRTPHQPFLFAVVSGYSEGPSGDGRHIHEHFGQYAWPRQCCDSDGASGHAGDAVAQPAERHGHRRDDHVFGAEQFGALSDSDQHHDVPCPGGAANPTDIFLPILIATAIATIVGLGALCIKQHIKMDKVILSWLGGIAAIVALVTWFFSSLPAGKVQLYSTFAANFILFVVILAFIGAGIRKKLRVYDVFIEGAKEGFKTAVMIIPYLVAILVAIGMFRASGALDVITGGVENAVAWLGFDTQWVGALPTMLMKPLSGSGSCAMMLDVMKANGPDAFVSKLAAAVRGSTDTTFYILAVYFGSVGVSRTRYAAGYALLADITGAIAAVIIAYLFF